MRIAWLSILPAALLAASCAGGPEAGQRYRAERDLSRTDWEYRNLSIQPGQVDREQWLALAQRYEGIADRYAGGGQPGTEDPVRRDIETLAARALFSAARIHAERGDSSRVEALFERMANDFGHLPDVAAEVALIRGGAAERRGERLAAAELYESVVGRIEPDPNAPGAPGVVLDLPLRAARLRAADLAGASREAAYAAARSYYERLAAVPAGGLVAVDAEARLAEVATDLGRWDEAMERLRRLEARLRESEDPPRQPCDIRLALYGVQSRAGVDLAVSRRTLTALLEEYPDCPQALDAMLALVSNASRRGEVDEAIGYLDRIEEVYRDEVEVGSRALLSRGQLLEQSGRWQEALAAFRAVPVQYPLSDAALRAPLEIVLHHARASDDSAAAGALREAERGYRDFISRYPPGRLSLMAREQLAKALALQGRHEAAVTEMVRLGDDLAGTQQGAAALLAAARMAYVEMADTARAVVILDHASELYEGAGVGRWAAAEATRLRGTMAP